MKSEQVSFNEVRWRLLRDADVMHLFLKKVSPEEWKPCWGQSMNRDGVLETIEARKGLNEYNVTRAYPDGSTEVSRFSGGQLQWTIETDVNGHKFFTTDKALISHEQGEKYNMKKVYYHGTDLVRETVIDNKEKKVISQKKVEKSQLSQEYELAVFMEPKKREDPQSNAQKTTVAQMVVNYVNSSNRQIS